MRWSLIPTTPHIKVKIVLFPSQLHLHILRGALRTSFLYLNSTYHTQEPASMLIGYLIPIQLLSSERTTVHTLLFPVCNYTTTSRPNVQLYIYYSSIFAHRENYSPQELPSSSLPYCHTLQEIHRHLTSNSAEDDVVRDESTSFNASSPVLESFNVRTIRPSLREFKFAP